MAALCTVLPGGSAACQECLAKSLKKSEREIYATAPHTHVRASTAPQVDKASSYFLRVTHVLIKNVKLILHTNSIHFRTSMIVALVLKEVESYWSRVESNQLEVMGDSCQCPGTSCLSPLGRSCTLISRRKSKLTVKIEAQHITTTLTNLMARGYRRRTKRQKNHGHQGSPLSF